VIGLRSEVPSLRQASCIVAELWIDRRGPVTGSPTLAGIGVFGDERDRNDLTAGSRSSIASSAATAIRMSVSTERRFRGLKL
jgi:hypothetical protein